MKKERIDVLLVEQGFFDSREKAKRAIMAGIVHDEHDIIDKPGTKIPVDSKLYVKGKVLPYVSRGGLKLEKAIKEFNLDLKDKIMVDIGSSTGGFTDCALQNGAKLVYAIDVGTNQLVWKLRNDPRVVVKEQTNFRYATKELFEYGIPSFASIDVSFISLKYIFEPLKDILSKSDQVVALIKPQFEAGREEVGKKGIVKDAKIHHQVIENVIEFAHNNNFELEQLTFSPITGGEGNIEFLGLFVKDGIFNSDINIDEVVNNAHDCFKR
ncbi:MULTISPECIES: TlyA family RNA methyltransferase [unclassified Thomasclavelia]|uniref:TlyA family RNA methyltransferase n=1 Tax=unclassified Thomasclavelia TaxID=3025756 RepID=UPI000B3AA1FB|nr:MULTISPECIES: TlyA family RNA methyltransferase [unclassified Thomasclavelia]OUP79038.1 TlyA family rRNA (cytidine-2'-O)-methyltransferase [Erysipelatoclostridium sp. An173]OUQ09339.1 TlyA family rRNA (cytidine-2'-O)-methyltransferase [Erysipelatoclostridium sp. An15]